MIKKIKFLLEKMPFFPLLAIAMKEIDLIKTQKIAIALILFYPIIVIVTLGFAYSGTEIVKVNVGFYVSPEATSFDSEKFASKIAEKSSMIKIISYDTEEALREAITKRKVRLGVIVREAEITQGRFVIDVINDNTDFISSALFFQATVESLRSVGFEISRTMITEVWSNLDSIRRDLGNETSRVKKFIAELDKSEKELIELKKSVESIDIQELKRNLEDQEKFVEETVPKVNSFREKIAGFQEVRNEKIEKVRESKQKVEDYKARITNAKKTLERAMELCSGNDAYGICQNLYSAHNTLSNAERDMDSAQAELTSLENELGKISTDLAAIDTELMDISNRIEASQRNLDYFNSKLDSIGTTVDKVNTLIDESLVAKQRISNDLNSSLSMLSSFISKLDDLKSLNPDFLANPIIINKINAYSKTVRSGNERLTVLTPITLAMVLLLTTILLTGVSFVVERNEGAYSRLLLSRTGKVTLFTGKILGQLIFSVLEASILLMLSNMLFGFQVKGSIIDLLIVTCVVSISFICLGLLITNYTKTQSTTILTGLLIVVPMIFISGIIIPVEFMSKPIQSLSSILPLNIGITLFVEVMLKGTSVLSLTEEIIKLLVPSLAFFIFTIFNRNL